MSENQKVAVVVSQKSALVGFLLAVFLGAFGVDRFYKGDTKIGIYKLLGVPLLTIVGFIAFGLFMAGNFITAIIVFLVPFVPICIFWALDWILVPLGISRDNARKLAQANGTVPNTQNSAANTSVDSLINGDLVTKIVFALILFVAVISWLLRQFG